MAPKRRTRQPGARTFMFSASGGALVREDFEYARDADGVDRARWSVWLRFAAKDGQLLVTELRITPYLWRTKHDRQSGQWQDDSACYADSPPGDGITQRMVRQIRVGSLIAFAQTSITHPFRFSPVRSDAKPITVYHRRKRVLYDPPTATHFRRAEGEFIASMQRLLGAVFPGLPLRPRKRRNVGRPDEHYLELAFDYSAAIRTGSKHVLQDLARAWGEPTERIRDWVHETRRRGLLSKGKRGVPGGVLTPFALKLLSEQKKRTTRPRAKGAPTRRPRRSR